ncbi:MAG TPA: glycoside hydrolase family 3 N-terminal domain-containing protein [Jiangellaceae bacterium]|nr:glycoside hydrolase family 3 N-terminal domain-containing protein [Jiangellaceae bacterium]
MTERSRPPKIAVPALLSAALIAAAGAAVPATAASTASASENGATRSETADTSQPNRSDDIWVRAMLRRMNLEEKIGQMMTGYAYGATPDTVDERNTALYGVDTPAEIVEEYHLGGIIYFAWTDSLDNPEQVANLSNGLQRSALDSGSGIPLLISTDQEQGVVTRLGEPATPLPGSMAQGASRSVGDARRAAGITGEELAAVGINQNFAPIADVNVNPLNPVIGVRSFSSDPGLVSTLTSAQVHGYQDDAGITSTAKHFPGHGNTADDSHHDLPVIEHTREEWEQIDRPPFSAAIDAGVDSIMTAHIVVPSLDDSGLPATLSEPILTGELRESLGFDGVIVTDSLEMDGVRQDFDDGEIAVRTIEAGADMLLMSADPREAVEAITAAIDSGRLTEERLDQSVTRILRLKKENGVVDQPLVDPAATDELVGPEENLAEAQQITDRTITGIRNDAELLPLDDANQSARDVLVTGWGTSTTADLGAALDERGHSTSVEETGAQPTQEQVDAAVAAAEQNDLTVVLTQKAWDTEVTDPDARQQALVAALENTETPVVHVAVRDPYDIAYLPDVQTSLATYSYTSVSMESVARAIHGEISPTGRLPVDVPEAGDPGTILYPFGHALEW